MRDDALAIGRAGVEAVRADRLIARALQSWGASAVPRDTYVIAAGKAAGSMMHAWLASGLAMRQGLVATTHLSSPLPDGIPVHLAGHPVPTAASEAAARAALALARERSDADLLIVLLSGGASAILSAPAEGLTLDDKMATTRLLLGAGAAIDELNAVRKHLSAIKGGQLAAAARCPVMTYALSDVVGPVPNDPSVIGSGPTVPDPSTYADALAVVERRGVRDRLPAAVRQRLEAGARGEVPETPKPGDPRLARASYQLVGSRAEAMDAARSAAVDRGYATVTIEAALVGEARQAGPAFVAQALTLVERAPRPACVIASGETTVHVVGTGRGGRNQEMALSVLPALSEIGGQGVFLSVGTDGIDGPTDAAGAIVDHGSLARARATGLDSSAFLSNNDAYHFFDRLGDLIRTGPSDTNVGDLQVLLLA